MKLPKRHRFARVFRSLLAAILFLWGFTVRVSIVALAAVMTGVAFPEIRNLAISSGFAFILVGFVVYAVGFAVVGVFTREPSGKYVLLLSLRGAAECLLYVAACAFFLQLLQSLGSDITMPDSPLLSAYLRTTRSLENWVGEYTDDVIIGLVTTAIAAFIARQLRPARLDPNGAG